jgi:serine/threonine protein kinase
MRDIVTILGAGAVIALLAAATLGPLGLRVAGVDPQDKLTAPDRVRYTSMGTVVLLTALAATASMTIALALIFSPSRWLEYLPVGIIWGSIVLNFDRWIVSSIDYGALTEAEMESGKKQHIGSKIVHFLVRFMMAALVGLVISEPIVLAVFGPEITQQLIAQHVTDISAQTAQIYAAERQRASQINAPVVTAQNALNSATRTASTDHTIYICEMTGNNCNLPPGEVTGIPGSGPQARADYAAWQTALALEQADQKILDKAASAARSANEALASQTSVAIAQATKATDADNGLLAREKALDTLSRENPGFLLRRVVLWLALMFIDLAPVLLKTFSPRTVYEVTQRATAVRKARNEISDAMAESDHESAKSAITRTRELEFHGDLIKLVYGITTETLRTILENAVRAEAAKRGAVTALPGAGRGAGRGGGYRRTGGDHGGQGGDAAGRGGDDAGRGGDDAGRGGDYVGRDGDYVGRGGDYAGRGPGGGQGLVIGRRWLVQRMLGVTPGAGRIPFVAVDLYGEYPYEVVVKIIAPPPRVGGRGAASERRHALMEMSLPQGHIHENIAEVLDSDIDPEHGYYLVTKLFPLTLDRFLREATEHNTLTVGVVLRLGLQILEGLQAAWEFGYVHLDLKPANIALTEDLTVKLIDFGLARHYQEAAGNNTATSTARFTMFYAPPEQMECRPGWITRNADLRALAAVIYKMLTGQPPMYREAQSLGIIDELGRWENATAFFDLKELIGFVDPVPVATLIGYVPAELDTLLRSWLSRDPNMRAPGKPQTMPHRVREQLMAIYEQVSENGEAEYPAGLRVTQEPAFASLLADWQRRSADGAGGHAAGPSPFGGAGGPAAYGRHARPDADDPPTIVPPDTQPGGAGPVPPAGPLDGETTLS